MAIKGCLGIGEEFMNAIKGGATAATCLLVLLMSFQVLLALGLPLGKAAWGGEHRVLPANLRWASLAAVFILALAIWMVLARANLMPPGADPQVVRILAWLFSGYFTLNIAMNLLSKSSFEKLIMTPTAAILVVCYVIVARS